MEETGKVFVNIILSAFHGLFWDLGDSFTCLMHCGRGRSPMEAWLTFSVASEPNTINHGPRTERGCIRSFNAVICQNSNTKTIGLSQLTKR